MSFLCGQLCFEEVFGPAKQNSMECHGGWFYVMPFKQNLGPQ